MKKNYNLFRLYNISQIRFESNKIKNSKSQIFYYKSLLNIYSYMNRDKITIFENNDKDIDNIISQILEISKQFSKESKDKKNHLKEIL